MNAMDILGSLLNGSRGGSGSGNAGRPPSSSSNGGLGGKILGELLKGATGGGSTASAPAPKPANSRGTSVPTNRTIDVARESQSLEDLLGVATGMSNSTSTNTVPSSYRPAPAPPRYQAQPPDPVPSRNAPFNSALSTEDEAIVLIRALINAAKADGRIDNQEQQSILSQVPNDPQTINFLKQEFGQPLDVRDFAWSVPLGMEIKVYTMTLAGMRLDTNSEAQYLKELAHGLRLDPDLCNQIHSKYGIEAIF
jgi:Protein of unknown function (DUF533)